eukprot:scaffold33844_cov101-Isochrysis_galbana.AAC.5
MLLVLSPCRRQRFLLLLQLSRSPHLLALHNFVVRYYLPHHPTHCRAVDTGLRGRYGNLGNVGCRRPEPTSAPGHTAGHRYNND